MGKIRRDFIGRECRRLALCGAGLAVCLLVLSRCYAKMASYWPMLLLALLAVIGLAALRSALLARAAMDALTDQDAYLLEKEFSQSHPVYRVWQGEIHLMPSFIVCRNRGRLLFIPIPKIERVEQRFDRIGLRRVPMARFVMDGDHTYVIGFSPSHTEDGAAVFAWLAERIGREKAGG